MLIIVPIFLKAGIESTSPVGPIYAVEPIYAV
jgi:hypothetical protein